MRAVPLLWLLIGPNGAGKSTYYEARIRPHLAAEFVNADRIAASRWPTLTPAREAAAARLADERRRVLLAGQRSFVAETVFSHPSKLELVAEARRAGYAIYVTLICVDAPDLSVVRVAQRVERGGHDVPREKILARYERMLPLAATAIRVADRGYVVDNSSATRPLRDVVLFEGGLPTYVAPSLPRWVKKHFQADLRRDRRMR